MKNFLTRPIPEYPERSFKQELTARWTMSETIRASIFGSLFFGLIMAFAPLAWGPLQFRVADILDFAPFDRKYGGRAAVVGMLVGGGLTNLVSPYGFAEILGTLSGVVAFTLYWWLGIRSRGQWWGKVACFAASVGVTELFIAYLMLHRIFGLPLMEILTSIGIEMCIISALSIVLLSGLERTYRRKVTV